MVPGAMVSDRDVRAVGIIRSQSERMIKMLQLLLDSTQLDMGQIQLHSTAVDFASLVTRVVEELSHASDHHTFTILTPDMPVMVTGDEVRLEQVVRNLVENAIKYSPGGGTITITVRHHGQGAELVVQDPGIGIPPDAIPQLFQRFSRVGGSRAHTVSGLGLGLYIVNEIVTLHGGSIEVQSREGDGSTFTVHLPVA